MDVEIIFTEIIKLLNSFQMILVRVGLLTTSWTPLGDEDTPTSVAYHSHG